MEFPYSTPWRIPKQAAINDSSLSQLIVRDIAPEVVAALKLRAASRGRSAEAEHREILEQALLGAPAASLKSMLVAMPNVGNREDFERPRRLARRVRL